MGASCKSGGKVITLEAWILVLKADIAQDLKEDASFDDEDLFPNCD